MGRWTTGMPPASKQKHTMPSKGVHVSPPSTAPSPTTLHSALTWKTQDSPSKMFCPVPRSISMNWSVLVGAAGFMSESR